MNNLPKNMRKKSLDGPCSACGQSSRYPSGSCRNCQRSRDNNLRKRRLAQGLCAACGKREKLEGITCCKPCSERKKQKKKAPDWWAVLSRNREESYRNEALFEKALEKFMKEYGRLPDPGSNTNDAFVLAKIWDDSIVGARYLSEEKGNDDRI